MRRLLVLSLVVLAAGCGPRSTDHWLRQLKDPDVVKRRQAVRELGARTAEAERVVPALAEALRDADPHARAEAAFALADPPKEPRERSAEERRLVLPLLRGLLDDPDEEVRGNAARTLSQVSWREGDNP